MSETKKDESDLSVFICYDCEAEHEYTDADFYQYYDAQLGMLVAFTCKSCGLTNSK